MIVFSTCVIFTPDLDFAAHSAAQHAEIERVPVPRSFAAQVTLALPVPPSCLPQRCNCGVQIEVRHFAYCQDPEKNQRDTWLDLGLQVGDVPQHFALRNGVFEWSFHPAAWPHSVTVSAAVSGGVFVASNVLTFAPLTFPRVPYDELARTWQVTREELDYIRTWLSERATGPTLTPTSGIWHNAEGQPFR